MQQLDIEKYLVGKGKTLRRASDKEVHTLCFFHNEEAGERGRLYINVDPAVDTPGMFFCHRCGEKGWAKDILEHFGDTLQQSESTESVGSLYSIFNEAAEYYHGRLLGNIEALAYLTDTRGLTLETIKEHKLGWADGGLKRHLNDLGYKSDDLVESGLVKESGNDFLYTNITIPYVTAGNVTQIRGKEIGGKYFTLPRAKARLFNSDSTWNAETVLICEGEFDAMIAEQLGFAAVAVPGANTWQEGWTGYLSEVKRLFIVFDADKAGDDAAEKLAERLDHARRVRLPIDGTDISDWVVKHGAGYAEMEQLLASIKSDILITVDEAYTEWKENEGNPNRQGLLLGLEGLDTFIKPGLLPGQVFVTQAKTGVGKTLGVLNFFERMTIAQPEMKILFLSLEQTRSEWFERAWRIHRLYEMIQDPQEAQDAAYEYWKHRIKLVDKNRVKPGEFRAAVEEHAYDYGSIDLIAVDYLGYWARSFKGEQYQRTTDAIMMLKELAKEWRVPIMTPHQVNRKGEAGTEPGINDARDSGAVEETADFLVAFWAPDQKQEHVGVNTDLNSRGNMVNMRMLKSRHGGVGTKVETQLAPHSLVLAPKSDPKLLARAEDEVEWYRGGDSYEVAMQRHFTGSKKLGV